MLKFLKKTILRSNKRASSFAHQRISIFSRLYLIEARLLYIWQYKRVGWDKDLP